MKSLHHGTRINSGTTMGKELYRVEDDMGYVVVTRRGDKRVLSFDSALEQSSVLMTKPYYLTHEYTQAMLLGLLFMDAEHITLLGLGGGGLAHCLSHYYPAIRLQVVELRQAVIDVAYEWFNLPHKSQLQVIQCDAVKYLSDIRPGCTDIIFSDLYLADGMSECQAQQVYIENGYNALTDSGCLVINYHVMPDKESVMMLRLRALFSQIYTCDVINGNQLLFCSKHSVPFSDEVLAERAEGLVQQVKMPLMYYCRQLQVL